MHITDYLTEEAILTGAAPEDKEGVCEALIDHLIAAGRIPADRRGPLVAKLMERERLSSTGIGGQVAIPHASGEKLDRLIVAMAQIPGGVEFDALDGEPVKLVFLIVGADSSPRTHLQVLAMIVRVCKNRDLVRRLIGAASAAEAYGFLSTAEG